MASVKFFDKYKKIENVSHLFLFESFVVSDLPIVATLSGTPCLRIANLYNDS